MKQAKLPLGGKLITRAQALQGLGNPKVWEKEAAELQVQFERKPTRMLSPVKHAKKLLEHAKKIGKRVSGFVSGPKRPEPVFAGAAAKQNKSKRRKSTGRKTTAPSKRIKGKKRS